MIGRYLSLRRISYDFVNDINDTNEIHRESPHVVPGCMILENLWNY